MITLTQSVSDEISVTAENRAAAIMFYTWHSMHEAEPDWSYIMSHGVM